MLKVRLNYNILILIGLSDLLKPNYIDQETAITLLKEALRNLSRETALLIQVKELKWSPARRSQLTIDETTLHVSDIDLETTIKLQTEYLQTERRPSKRRTNFAIVKL